MSQLVTAELQAELHSAEKRAFVTREGSNRLFVGAAVPTE
jgi:hypothetical protein